MARRSSRKAGEPGLENKGTWTARTTEKSCHWHNPMRTQGPSPPNTHTEYWAPEPHSTSTTSATTRMNSLQTHLLVPCCSFRFSIWRDAPECINRGGMPEKQGPSTISFSSGSRLCFPPRFRIHTWAVLWTWERTQMLGNQKMANVLRAGPLKSQATSLFWGS